LAAGAKIHPIEKVESKRMRRFRSFLGLIILASLCGVGGLAWYTISPPGIKKISTGEPASAADLKLDRLRYTETREGVKEWELEAASAQYFKEDSSVVFEKVRAAFYGKNEQVYSLEGEKGRLDTQTKEIRAFDGVKLETSDGYRLQTRSLQYQADKRELRTGDPVELRGPQGKITGTGLVVQLDQQRIRILRQVNVVLTSWSPAENQRKKP
jgi:LPS export ABC transporter protein LptC